MESKKTDLLRLFQELYFQRRTNLLRLVLLLIAVNQNAQSQDAAAQGVVSCRVKSCFCNSDPTPAGIMISHIHDKREWMTSYRFSGIEMDGIKFNGQQTNLSKTLSKYNSSPNMMKMQMHMLMIMYGINKRLTIMGMTHYMVNYMEMTMKYEGQLHRHGMKTKGITDTKIYLLWQPTKIESDHSFIISGAVNLPTGSINLKGTTHSMIYNNSRYPYNMQLGSGTFDIISGLNYLWKGDQLSFSSQATSALRLYKNKSGYRLGNDFVINCWTAYQWMNYVSNSLRFEVSHSEKIVGKDASLLIEEDVTADPNNYGGTSSFVYLGCNLHIRKGICKKGSLALEAGIPVFQKLNGFQTSYKYNYHFTWLQKF